MKDELLFTDGKLKPLAGPSPFDYDIHDWETAVALAGYKKSESYGHEYTAKLEVYEREDPRPERCMIFDRPKILMCLNVMADSGVLIFCEHAGEFLDFMVRYFKPLMAMSTADERFREHLSKQREADRRREGYAPKDDSKKVEAFKKAQAEQEEAWRTHTRAEFEKYTAGLLAKSR